MVYRRVLLRSPPSHVVVCFSFSQFTRLSFCPFLSQSFLSFPLLVIRDGVQAWVLPNVGSIVRSSPWNDLQQILLSEVSCIFSQRHLPPLLYIGYSVRSFSLSCSSFRGRGRGLPTSSLVIEHAKYVVTDRIRDVICSSSVSAELRYI